MTFCQSQSLFSAILQKPKEKKQKSVGFLLRDAKFQVGLQKHFITAEIYYNFKVHKCFLCATTSNTMNES